MSQPETNEILNPTHTFGLPLQVITEEQNSVTKLLANTTNVPASKVMTDPSNYQMTPASFAAKQKILAHINFNTGQASSTDIFAVSFTPGYFVPYFTFASAFKVRNFDIEVNAKPTNNSMFQGLYRLYFDAAPSTEYYSWYGNGINTANSFQLPGINITGNSADVQKIYIPKLYPFNYFYQTFTGTPSEVNYMRDYPMGRLVARVISPLATTGTITTMPTMLTMALPNFTYGATKINN
jgi:hypothetical protein